MKTQYEKMFDLLVKGYPPEKVREKYPRRGATLTKALQMYFEWASPRIKDLQRKVGPLESQLRTLEGDVRLKTDQNAELDRRILEKKETFQNLQRDLEKLVVEIKEKQAFLSRLQKLADKGVPLDLVTRIYDLEVESGEELTSRIKTVEAHEQEKRNFTELVKQKRDLERNIDGFNRRKIQVKKDLDTLGEDTKFQKNELELEKEKTRLYREVVEVTEGFLKDGYSIKDLKDLRSGLKGIAIRGKPKVSLSRLIKGLQNVKSLNRLYDEIEKAEKTRETLNSKISKAEGILDTIKEKVLATLDDVLRKVLEDIKDVGTSAVNETQELRKSAIEKLDSMNKKAVNNLNTLIRTAKNNINQVSKTAQNITAYVDTEIERAAKNLKSAIFFATKQYKEDMEEWNTLKEKAGDYEELMEYGYVLLGVLESPEGVKKLPVSLISQLMNRIHLYTQFSFPDARTTPSQTVHYMEYSFNAYRGYKLPALTLWLKEEFEKMVWESVKNAR